MQESASRRGLYAIVDPEFCRDRDVLLLAESILAGGCAVLQLRAKRLRGAELETLALALRDRCVAAGVAFVINDYPQLAARVGAGVHLGQSDMPVREARQLLGAERSIGVSTHDLLQAQKALSDGADRIGFGPVFETATKINPDPVVGLHALREVCEQVALPVIAIGGITPENAAEVARAGATMAAAITALSHASDPRAAAERLHRALGGAPRAASSEQTQRGQK